MPVRLPAEGRKKPASPSVGREQAGRGWYLGVDTVLMHVSRIISEYKFISLIREPGCACSAFDGSFRYGIL